LSSGKFMMPQLLIWLGRRRSKQSRHGEPCPLKGRIKQLAVDAGYDNVSVTDAAGRTWQSGDIYATGAVTASLL
jgi:hypothetical protein